MMENKEFKEELKSPETPKSKQLVQMLSFRVVPAYFREIEKVFESFSKEFSTNISESIKETVKDVNEKTFKQLKENLKMLKN